MRTASLLSHTFARTFTGAALLAACAPAFAHPGHDIGSFGFAQGLLHPLTGFDHLLAMIVVGIWAAQLGGAARLWVPASFMAMMAAGAGLAFAGWMPPAVESGIAASLLVLGLVSAAALRLPLPAAMSLTGVFALFHGAAHGSELPTLASPALFSLGFLAATALLHGMGLVLAHLSFRRLPILAQAAGAGVAASGLAFALLA